MNGWRTSPTTGIRWMNATIGVTMSGPTIGSCCSHARGGVCSMATTLGFSIAASGRRGRDCWSPGRPVGRGSVSRRSILVAPPPPASTSPGHNRRRRRVTGGRVEERAHRTRQRGRHHLDEFLVLCGRRRFWLLRIRVCTNWWGSAAKGRSAVDFGEGSAHDIGSIDRVDGYRRRCSSPPVCLPRHRVSVWTRRRDEWCCATGGNRSMPLRLNGPGVTSARPLRPTLRPAAAADVSVAVPRSAPSWMAGPTW